MVKNKALTKLFSLDEDQQEALSTSIDTLADSSDDSVVVEGLEVAKTDDPTVFEVTDLDSDDKALATVTDESVEFCEMEDKSFSSDEDDADDKANEELNKIDDQLVEELKGQQGNPELSSKVVDLIKKGLSLASSHSVEPSLAKKYAKDGTCAKKLEAFEKAKKSFSSDEDDEDSYVYYVVGKSSMGKDKQFLKTYEKDEAEKELAKLEKDSQVSSPRIVKASSFDPNPKLFCASGETAWLSDGTQVELSSGEDKDGMVSVKGSEDKVKASDLSWDAPKSKEFSKGGFRGKMFSEDADAVKVTMDALTEAKVPYGDAVAVVNSVTQGMDVQEALDTHLEEDKAEEVGEIVEAKSFSKSKKFSKNTNESLQHLVGCRSKIRFDEKEPNEVEITAVAHDNIFFAKVMKDGKLAKTWAEGVGYLNINAEGEAKPYLQELIDNAQEAKSFSDDPAAKATMTHKKHDPCWKLVGKEMVQGEVLDATEDMEGRIQIIFGNTAEWLKPEDLKWDNSGDVKIFSHKRSKEFSELKAKTLKGDWSAGGLDTSVFIEKESEYLKGGDNGYAFYMNENEESVILCQNSEGQWLLDYFSEESGNQVEEVESLEAGVKRLKGLLNLPKIEIFDMKGKSKTFSKVPSGWMTASEAVAGAGDDIEKLLKGDLKEMDLTDKALCIWSDGVSTSKQQEYSDWVKSLGKGMVLKSNTKHVITKFDEEEGTYFSVNDGEGEPMFFTNAETEVRSFSAKKSKRFSKGDGDLYARDIIEAFLNKVTKGSKNYGAEFSDEIQAGSTIGEYFGALDPQELDFLNDKIESFNKSVKSFSETSEEDEDEEMEESEESEETEQSEEAEDETKTESDEAVTEEPLDDTSYESKIDSALAPEDTFDHSSEEDETEVKVNPEAMPEDKNVEGSRNFSRIKSNKIISQNLSSLDKLLGIFK